MLSRPPPVGPAGCGLVVVVLDGQPPPLWPPGLGLIGFYPMDAQLHPPPSALSKSDTALDPFGWHNNEVGRGVGGLALGYSAS